MLKCVCKHKTPQIAKTVLRKKNKTRETMVPDLKLYYKAMVVITEWYCHKNKYQWNRIESPEINTHLDSDLLQMRQIIRWAKDSLFNKWCWKNWTAACERIKCTIFSHYIKKIHSKCIKDLKVRPETIKFL